MDQYFLRLLSEAIGLFNATLARIPVELHQFTRFELGPGSKHQRGRPAMIGISCARPSIGALADHLLPMDTRFGSFSEESGFHAAGSAEKRKALSLRIESWRTRDIRASVFRVEDMQRTFPKPLSEAIGMFQKAQDSIPGACQHRAIFDLYGYSEYGRDHPTIEIAYWRPRTAPEQADQDFMTVKMAMGVEQYAAFRALVNGPRDVAVAKLFEMVRSGDTGHATKAAQAIAWELLGPDLIDGLKSGLDHPTELIRWYFVEALSKIANRRNQGGVWAPFYAYFFADPEKYLAHWRNWTPE